MSKLTVTYLNATFGSGTSTKSGTPKPYRMANVNYLTPCKNFQNTEHNIQKAGMEPKQINMLMDQKLYDRIAATPSLTQVDFVLGADPENPARNIIVDFKVSES